MELIILTSLMLSRPEQWPHACKRDSVRSLTSVSIRLFKKRERSLSTLDLFLCTQSMKAYYNKTRHTVGISRLLLNCDRNGLSQRLSPVVGGVQNAVPQSMQRTILHLPHCSTLADHTGELCLHYTFWYEYFRKHMFMKQYDTSRIDLWMETTFKYESRLQLSLPIRPLECIGIIILATLLRTVQNNVELYQSTQRVRKDQNILLCADNIKYSWHCCFARFISGLRSPLSCSAMCSIPCVSSLF